MGDPGHPYRHREQYPELDIRLLSQVITVLSHVEHGPDTRINNLVFRMVNMIRVTHLRPWGGRRARPERRSVALRRRKPRLRAEPRPPPGPTPCDPRSPMPLCELVHRSGALSTRAGPPDRVAGARRGNVPDHRADLSSSTRRHLLTSPGPDGSTPERWRRGRTSTCRWGADEWRQGRGQPP